MLEAVRNNLDGVIAGVGEIESMVSDSYFPGSAAGSDWPGDNVRLPVHGSVDEAVRHTQVIGRRSVVGLDRLSDRLSYCRNNLHDSHRNTHHLAIRRKFEKSLALHDGRVHLANSAMGGGPGLTLDEFRLGVLNDY